MIADIGMYFGRQNRHIEITTLYLCISVLIRGVVLSKRWAYSMFWPFSRLCTTTGKRSARVKKRLMSTCGITPTGKSARGAVRLSQVREARLVYASGVLSCYLRYKLAQASASLPSLTMIGGQRFTSLPVLARIAGGPFQRGRRVCDKCKGARRKAAARNGMRKKRGLDVNS